MNNLIDWLKENYPELIEDVSYKEFDEDLGRNVKLIDEDLLRGVIDRSVLFEFIEQL